MELIKKIQENNIPLTEDEINKLKEQIAKLDNAPVPTNETEAGLLLADIQTFKVYAGAIETFVKDKTSELNAKHKKGVAVLKVLKDLIKDASNYQKVLEYANEELKNNPEFKLKGTTLKNKLEIEYDEKELINIFIPEKMQGLLRLNTPASVKNWLKENQGKSIVQALKYEVKEYKEIV